MNLRGAFAISFLSAMAPSVVLGQVAKPSVTEIYSRLNDNERQALYGMLLADKRVKREKAAAKPTPSNERTVKAAALPAATAAPDLPKCATQSFFLRRDRTDIFEFLIPCGPADVPGATASYTNNLATQTHTLAIQALTGYTVKRGQNSEGTFLYSVTPSALFSGTLAEPFKATERNAVRAALDTQFLLSTPDFIFRTHTVGVAPYYQTDFRGMARIEGVDVVWEPYNVDILLGGRFDEQARRLVGFYWRLQAEADINRVERAGLTNFVSGTNHAFLGGTLQARMIFFQNMPEVGEALCGRLYASATAQRFADVAGGPPVSNYTAEIGYYLNPGVAPYWRFCVPRKDGEAPLPSASATSSAISFVYNNGTDKTTQVNQQQYKFQLSFRF